MGTHTADPRFLDHRAERIDLAAAFRGFARLDMHESVANHLSLAVSDDGGRFLIDAPDPTAWYLHSRLHEKVPGARCVMHLHSRYATALACLKDPTLYPIDMNTMRFFGRIVVDKEFSGMALSDDEGDRVAGLMGRGATVLMMANHGALVIGPTVAQAFDEFYHLERAARTLLTCYSTARELSIVSDEIAALTERQWRDYGQLSVDHFDNLKAILDSEDPSYTR
jgi:ribulose-5-phosphate 4-epimerase/fuculose-1-phosphate aldolase